MASDHWYWKEEGPEDPEFTAGELLDPLAELAVQLAICIDAIEQNIGAFCSECVCELGYHLSCDNGECENCGCYEIRRVCASCNKPRSIESYPVGSRECTFCIKAPPVKIKHPAVAARDVVVSIRTEIEVPDRAKDARDALKELTE